MFDLQKDDLQHVVKNADNQELEDLAEDIRQFLLEKVSFTGGHLASNMGIVELTIAMHRVYDCYNDRMIFDVGHQSYVHKILTGRASGFDTLRQHGGMSGFPKGSESKSDAYDTGHSSQSLSAAAGMATARDLAGEDYEVIALIGDGSMTGGLSFEALNNIGASGSKVRIILNDNGMSIARNVGGLSRHLTRLRTSDRYIRVKSSVKSALGRVPVIGESISDSISRSKDKIKYSILAGQGIIFEELGIKYIGPVNGYDMMEMAEAFEDANRIEGPTIVHVITTKGKGYKWSEVYPRRFHGVGRFDIKTGEPLSKSDIPTFSHIFGDAAAELAGESEKIVAITAAMGTATGLGRFCREFPDRYFDVGIAEQHAVIFAAGLAKGGFLPIVAIYSSFLQRAFDQIIEDVALQNLHVIFAIDRAGASGSDGETHQGQFDLSYLGMIPNMCILCPADGVQLRDMLRYAAYKCDGSVAIRYPKGMAKNVCCDIPAFDGENISLSKGKDLTILAVGNMLNIAFEVCTILKGEGFSVGIKDICVVKPYDDEIGKIDSSLVVTIEDNVFAGGFGSLFAAKNACKSYDVMNFSLPDNFIPQGTIDEQLDDCGLSVAKITSRIRKFLQMRH